MQQKGKILERLALSADLPGEYVPGLPIVEICNDSRVLIENHKGVTAYGCNEICVKVSFGTLCISGTCLALARMTHHQLVITGHIDGVSLKRR